MAADTFRTWLEFRIPKMKRVPTADGRGFTTEADGFILADIHVTVDAAAIVAAIGAKAMRNKSKQTKIQGGAIVLEAKNIRNVVKV